MASLFTYFAYQDSLIHRLDPRAKSLWVAVGTFIIFSTDDWRLLLALVGVNLVLAVVAQLNPRALLPVLGALVTFGVVILFFQLLFQPGPTFFAVGPIYLHTDGFYITREVWLRLANLSLLFVEYIMWTHPTDIALMWVRLGLPYRYAMLAGLALRFFPILQEEVGRIQSAQQVRGQPLHSFRQRLTGMGTVAMPFILRALRRTNEIALSMELRGFGYGQTRTFTRNIGMKSQDWALVVVLIGVLGLRLLTMARVI